MRGGLADHTERLASELASECKVALLTSAGTQAKRSFSVHAEIRDWQNPTELLRVIQSIDPERTIKARVQASLQISGPQEIAGDVG